MTISHKNKNNKSLMLYDLITHCNFLPFSYSWFYKACKFLDLCLLSHRVIISYYSTLVASHMTMLNYRVGVQKLQLHWVDNYIYLYSQRKRADDIRPCTAC